MPDSAANKTFADILAQAIGITSASAIASLEAAVDAWNGGSLSNAELAYQISEFTADVRLRDANFEAWANGTPTGGVGADGTGVGGYYPINYVGGGSVLWPSPAYLAATMAKGDRGSAAKQDVSIFFQYGPGPSEVLGAYVFRNALTLDFANADIRALVAPTNAASLAIQKNGTTVGTVNFAAGSKTATVQMTDPTLALHDQLTFQGPAVQDATLSTIYGTIPSALT